MLPQNIKALNYSDSVLVLMWFSDPVATGNAPVVNVSSYDVSVDWSKCFILNGPLVKYVVLQNGVHIFETQVPQAVKNTFPDRPMGGKPYRFLCIELFLCVECDVMRRHERKDAPWRSKHFHFHFRRIHLLRAGHDAGRWNRENCFIGEDHGTGTQLR